jgi:hypothetical protein
MKFVTVPDQVYFPIFLVTCSFFKFLALLLFKEYFANFEAASKSLQFSAESLSLARFLVYELVIPGGIPPVEASSIHGKN